MRFRLCELYGSGSRINATDFEDGLRCWISVQEVLRSCSYLSPGMVGANSSIGPLAVEA